MMHGPLIPATESPCESVATVIRDVSPFAFCPSCIAAKLTLAESNVRHAMQFLVSTTCEFAVTTRVCHGCHAATRLVEVRSGFVSRLPEAPQGRNP